MSEYQIGYASTIISILLVALGGSFGIINAFFWYTLKRIKKDIDSLWSKRNIDHDDITRIKAKLDID